MTKSAKGSLHAMLREIEPGLYRAEYSRELGSQHRDERELPDFHIGTDPIGVKAWVEEMAISLGYEKVVWNPS